MAEILGVSTQTIANYENGHRAPNFDTLLKIADYFNVTVDYLIGRSDYRTVEEQISKRSKFERTVGKSLKEAIINKKLEKIRWDEKIENEAGTFIEEILKHSDNLENLTSVYEKYNNEIKKIEERIGELNNLISSLMLKFADLTRLFYAGIRFGKVPRFDYLFEEYGKDFVINYFRSIISNQNNKEGESDGSKDT